MNFNIHQSVNKTEYFLNPLIIRELLKLLENSSN